MEIPKTISEAIDAFITLISPSLSDNPFKDESSFMAQAHHGIGRWIRNEWKLWHEGEPLTDEFTAMGIVHGDDRSGIIMSAAFRKWKNLPLGIEQTVENYKNFWKQQGFEDGIPK